MIGHFRDESFQPSRQSIALLLTTKNNQTQNYIHQKHKRETEKTALANKTIYTLIWFGFYYLRSGNRVGPILIAPEPTQGMARSRWTCFDVSESAQNIGLNYPIINLNRAKVHHMITMDACHRQTDKRTDLRTSWQ